MSTRFTQSPARVATEPNGTLRNASIVVSEEDAAYPFSNATNWNLSSEYKSEGAASITIDATYSEDPALTCFVLAGSNLQLVSGTLVVSYSTDGGSGYTEVINKTITANRAIYILLPEVVGALDWQIELTANDVIELSLVDLCTDYVMQAGFWDGYSSPDNSTQWAVRGGGSDGPNFVGRVSDAEMITGELVQPYADETFSRTTWYNLQQDIMRGPFFLLWNSDGYPDEAAYCWISGTPKNPTISTSKPHFDMSLPYEGLARIGLNPEDAAPVPPEPVNPFYVWHAEDYTSGSLTWPVDGDSPTDVPLNVINAATNANADYGGYPGVGGTATGGGNPFMVMDFDALNGEFGAISPPFSFYTALYIEDTGTGTGPELAIELLANSNVNADTPRIELRADPDVIVETTDNDGEVSNAVTEGTWYILGWSVDSIVDQNATYRFHTVAPYDYIADGTTGDSFVIQTIRAAKSAFVPINAMELHLEYHDDAEMAAIMDSMAQRVGYAPGTIT